MKPRHLSRQRYKLLASCDQFDYYEIKVVEEESGVWWIASADYKPPPSLLKAKTGLSIRVGYSPDEIIADFIVKGNSSAKKHLSLLFSDIDRFKKARNLPKTYKVTDHSEWSSWGGWL